MKILYGIQGTGHGHISRAREILPILSQKAEVDLLISGTNCKLKLDNPDISYRTGLSLTYDSNGGVSYLQTALSLNPIRFLKDVKDLEIESYDLVVSDYEPISSWAAMKVGKRCIGLSHQAAFLSSRTPRPSRTSVFAEQILKHFAPSHKAIGFHFLRYDRFIEGPIIRSDVRNLNPVDGDHISVYLPAYDHRNLISIFRQCGSVRWEIFSPLCGESYTTQNVTVNPVGNESFLKSLESCSGVLTSAGFETCAESIYLGKKLMVVPIKNQYEQLCNAMALEKMGVPVQFELGEYSVNPIQKWLKDSSRAVLPEIADTEKITDKLIRYAGGKKPIPKQKEVNKKGAILLP
ncbi:hypothetical protein DYD21_14910 [Rhodohalobacter sp. SW132]|uniref:glycosyltransferase family protein n=1 Tax=Rhodohalobacter sp. SW132 TaxID=2293433 RepID=UPI000E23AA20|nr:glycosyltransferase family protein [Rhodohalobacter sp. SW132]REL29142.1 hypothetical protein DYD21_14910 [Rhodohalobacter sp. SW132]